jgi:hypothetical protein
MVLSAMIKAARLAARFLGRHASSLIALLSLALAITSLLRTIDIEKRASERQELLIVPSLSFAWDIRLDKFELRIKNDGLGPAVINRWSFRIGEDCVDSLGYASLDAWFSAVQHVVGPSLQKLLVSDVEKVLIDSSSQDVKGTKAKKNGVTVVEYSDSSFALGSLELGTMIAPGKDKMILDLNVAVTRKLGNATQRVTNNLLDSYQNQINKLQIGVGYCSVSGGFCGAMVVGDAGTCWGGSNPIGSTPWPGQVN